MLGTHTGAIDKAVIAQIKNNIRCDITATTGLGIEDCMKVERNAIVRETGYVDVPESAEVRKMKTRHVIIERRIRDLSRLQPKVHPKGIGLLQIAKITVDRDRTTFVKIKVKLFDMEMTEFPIDIEI